MPLTDTLAPPGLRLDRTADSTVMTGLLVLFVICVRWRALGNPIVHIDEEFYHLVGSRMLQGAIPYVDIWDRKPIGLFLIFAGIDLVGGGSPLADQVAALLVVTLTATIVFLLARRVAGVQGGVLSALLYVACLDIAGGEACQAPVWYNLPVVAGVALVFFARSSDSGRRGDFRRAGIVAMALFGMAMQIKYSAVFEGLFLGLSLVLMSVTRGRPVPLVAVDCSLWIASALLPTALAAAYYYHIGHFADWYYANLVSIFGRGVEPAQIVKWRIVELSAVTAPLVIAWLLRPLLGPGAAGSTAREGMGFLDAWALSAVAGVIVFGTWYNHYALPLFAPLAVVTAPLTATRWGKACLVVMLAAVLAWGQHILQRHRITRGDDRLLTEVTSVVRDHRGCLFVYDGLLAVYETARSCLPNSRVFPGHFAGQNEENASGIDQQRVVAAVMARRPDRVTSMEPGYANENPASRSAFYRVVRADYTEIARFRRGDRWLVVYGLERRARPAPPEPGRSS